MDKTTFSSPDCPLPAGRGERRWVIGFAVAVMLITTLPYLVGYASQGTEWRFTGFVFAVEDGNSYIAKMLSGAAGAWLFRTPYTPSPQHGILVFLPYLLLGKLAAPPGLHEQLVALYHLFRFGAGFLAILATYDFLAFFLKSVGIRRLGLVLAVLGGGLGWALVLLGKDNLLGSLPLEFYSPETFGFLGLYGIPHLALARAFLLWGLLAYLRACFPQSQETSESSWIRTGVKIGFLWLLTGLAQPLTGMLVGAVIGIYIIALAFWQSWCGLNGRITCWTRWWRMVRLAFLAGLIPAPLVLYNFLSVYLDPFLRTWTAQNLIPSPHPIHYLLAYGFFIPFAWIGARRLLKLDAWQGWLPTAWILSLPVLAYIPFSLQRRLPEGSWVALVVLAMAGLESWKYKRLEENESVSVLAPHHSQNPSSFSLIPGRLSLFLIPFPFTLLSTLLLLIGGLLTAQRAGLPAFRPADETAAFEFLAEKARVGETVLSSYETGNALPAWAPVRVVIGHGPESAGLSGLLLRVKSFYTPASPDAERQELIRQLGVRFVFWGPAERALGQWDPGSADYLRLIHRSGEYAIYEVITAP